MQQERNKLKSYLQKIKENEFVVDVNVNVNEYVQLMYKYIGDVDSELRDDLIYETFYYWIKIHKVFSEEQLIEMIFTLIDENHLFKDNGKRDDDSVFTRSFSMLVLAILLSYHKESSFLDKTTFTSLTNALVKYYKTERDYRGFVENKGWAHSIAHGADAFNELVLCDESDELIHNEVLESIEQVLFNKTHIFGYKEDDRIANIVYSMYEKKRISVEKLIMWFNNLGEKCNFKQDQETYISSVNFRNFNRSFYFKLKHYKGDANLLNAVLNVEKSLNSTIH